MGIAGISVLLMFYFLYKSIQSIVRFFIWKSKINTIGTIKAFKDKNVNYDNKSHDKISSTDYIYEMEIREAGKEYTVEYIESVTGDKPRTIQAGQSIPVFFDSKNMQTRDVRGLKKDLWQFPLCVLLCIAIFVVCLLIVLGSA